MKKLACVVLIAVVMLAVSPPSGYAQPRRVHVGAHVRLGPGFFWGPWFYWAGPLALGPWYPYYHYPALPPVVVQQQAPVYAEPEQQQPYYWYYCQNPPGYYPYVRECPGGWMKVVPDVTPPHQ
jgi:hypothetical protein